MGEIGKRFRRGTWRKSEVKKRSDRWSNNEGRKSSFCLTGGHLSFEEHQKYKGRVVFLGRHCEKWFWILCGIYSTRIISITNDGSKGHGYHIQIARVRRTSSWCSICWNAVQNGRCSKITENPKLECPDIWIRLPRHKWPKSWSGVEDPVVLLERNLCGHLLAGLLWERHFEKILLQHGREKVSTWECLFVHREKGLFLICVRGWLQIGWKETRS